MYYGKLINNDLIFAPNPIIIDDRQIGNPPGEVYVEQGYYPVYYTEPPEIPDGFIAVPYWVEEMVDTELVIYQHWQIEQVPITEEDALVRYSNELTGAEDETLTEATETLIKKVMEE